MQRLDGKTLSQSIFARLSQATAAFRSQTGTQPKLTVISVGEDPASKVYVGQKQKRASNPWALIATAFARASRSFVSYALN